MDAPARMWLPIIQRSGTFNMRTLIRPQFSLLMLLAAVACSAIACMYVRWFGALGFITVAFIAETWGVGAVLMRLGVDQETAMGITWLVFLLTFYPLLLAVNWVLLVE